MKIKTKVYSFATFESSRGSSFKEFILLKGKVFSRDYDSWEDWYNPFEEDSKNQWDLSLYYGSNYEEPIDYRVERVKNGFVGGIDPFVDYEWVDVKLPNNKINLF